MITDTIYFNSFINSLRKDQREDFKTFSLNQQKDWYISYLESKI